MDVQPDFVVFTVGILINPTTVTGTYIITIPKSGYEGPNNFDDPVALALAADFFNECIARFKPFGYEGHWPPAYVESVTHQSRPVGHHPALRVEFTINPLYSPNAPYAFSGLHFVRHFLMEQGHSDNRFKSQPFWRAYRPAAHMKGIISSCLSRFTMIGGILLGLEPAHAGGDDFVGNVLQKHFFHVASERIKEKTSDDLTNVYRKYLIESKFFHQFGIVIDDVPCAAAYKEYTKRQFTKKFLLQIPQGSDPLTFDFLRWLCTRQDAATGEVEPWPLVIFGRKILFAPVPDPEHTSLEVFKEAGDVIHGAQTKTLEALQAPHAHSFSTVHIRDPLAVDVMERLCKLPGVITCGFPHQRKSQATVVRVFFASSVPNAPKSAEQFKPNIPHAIRAHIGFPQIHTMFSKSKNVFITSTNGQSPLPHLPRGWKNDIRSLIHSYGGDAGEITTGAKLLGSPVGSVDFSRKFLLKRLQSKCADPVNALIDVVQDPQVALILLKYCVQPMTEHLHFVDVATGSATSSSNSNYSSEFSTSVRSNHQRALSHIAGRTITPLAWLIATSSIGDGGLGLRDAVDTNLQGFVLPLARSMQYAKNGVAPLRRTRTENADIAEPFLLHPGVRDLFLNWELSQSPLFVAFRRYAPGLTQLDPDLAAFVDPIARLQHLVNHCPIKAVRRRINRAVRRNTFQRGMASQPPSVQTIVPSVMTELTSVAATSITRAERAFRFPTPLFKTYMRRKLRLPLFQAPFPKCRCGAVIDPEGDHIFNCPGYHYPRDVIHDTYRNASHGVLAQLAPLAGFVAGPHDVLHEPQNLIPDNPRLRPADTALSLESVNNSQHSYLLLDYSTSVKTTNLPPLTSPLSAPAPTAAQATQQHEIGENGKLHGPNRNSRRTHLNGAAFIHQLHQQNMILCPMTIDQHGQLGPLAYRLFTGKTHPHADRYSDNTRCMTGLASPEATHMLNLNYASSAPAGLFPKADRQWCRDLLDEGKHPSTHWFSGSYHARLPSQWAKQVLGFNTTLALTKYFHRAVQTIRRQESVHTSKNQPAGVVGLSRCSVMYPRSNRHLSQGMDPSSSGAAASKRR